MKLWIILLVATAIVAVASQSTSPTKKGKAMAAPASPPPSGIKASNRTTATPSSKKITQPPAKSANNAYSKCMCQDDIGMDQFQLSKYLGTWYMVNMQPLMPMNPYTGNCMNVTFSSTDTKNVIQATTSSKFSISTLKSNDMMTYIGQGVFTWKLTDLKFQTSKTNPNKTKTNEIVTAPMNTTLKYVVIDTDYTNYTVVYICGNYSLGTSLTIKSNPTKSPKSDSKSLNIPPNLFLLMSRTKATTANFDMGAVKNTIKAKYSCYHDMKHPSVQDSNTCRA